MPARTPTLALLVASALALGALRRIGGARARAHGRRSRVTLDDYLIRPQSLRVPARTAADRRASRTAAGSATRSGSGRASRNVLRDHDDRAGRDEVAQRSGSGAGSYTMYCALANHEELGMYGTLTVG